LCARSTRRAARPAAILAAVGTSLFAAIVGLAGAARAGASATAASRIPTVTIRARDFSFEMPAKIHAGWTTVRLVNDGGEPHQAQLAKLHPGVTADQIATAGAGGGDAAIVALFTAAGGPNSVPPQGGTASVTVNLTPGRYVAMCFVPSADGVRHYAKGMVQPFTVTRTRRTTGKAHAPKAKATMTLEDVSFGFPPDGLPATGVVAVKNAGAQDHEIALYRLADGRTLADAKAFLLTPPGVPPPAGDPPVTEAGGMVGLAPGATGYMNLSLRPGSYVAACFFPDADKAGLPHIIEGMLAEVSVD
jgi:hypothetical protein